MEDQIKFETQSAKLSKDKEQPGVAADDLQFLRSELITLAEKGEIKQSIAYIKKANHSILEKIKVEYERKQLQETNEYPSETLMEKLSEFMEGPTILVKTLTTLATIV